MSLTIVPSAQVSRSFNKVWIISFVLLILLSRQSSAQLIYQPYSYQFYQKLNKVIYSPANEVHSSIKPYLITDSSTIRPLYDSLMTTDKDGGNKNWIHQLLFDKHLVDIKNNNYTFYLDFLPDFQAGREFANKQTTYLNTRGYQLSLTIGSNFFIYTSGYENQGSFANYENSYINKTGMVPGQAYGRNTTYSTSDDWAYVTALIGYRINKSIMVVMGEDKTFIGDGYRSILLSDYASAYPLLRLTANLGPHIQYMAMWTYLEDQNAVKPDTSYSYRNNRRKWAAFHYIDWNITNRASLGFFNAIIAEEANDNGTVHGFDLNYFNPILFSSSLAKSNGATDHTLIGFNGSYKIGSKTTAYGQLLFDQGLSSSTSSKNAWQLGFRGADLFKVNGLNYLVEYNTASPYTYSNQSPIVSYTQLAEPLAHPFGANFKEWLGIMNYTLGRFDLQGQFEYAQYGLDTGNMNYGKDITLPNNTSIPLGANVTGQGLATTLKYAEGTVSYLLNPKYNLRIEIGGLVRQEKNSQTDTKTALVTFGLRSSFRNLYHDF